jgi:hypothetical protein
MQLHRVTATKWEGGGRGRLGNGTADPCGSYGRSQLADYYYYSACLSLSLIQSFLPFWNRKLSHPLSVSALWNCKKVVCWEMQSRSRRSLVLWWLRDGT